MMREESMPTLVDPYARTIDYLRISITDRCNLRCLYCMPSGGVRVIPREELLHYEEIHRVVTLAIGMGVKKVRITGGEPLVRSGVIPLIASLAEIPGLEDISLTTNGTLLEAFARPLKEAGLKRVNVSLDTLDPKKYAHITRGDELSQVWRGIRRALEEDLTPLKINMVVIRGLNDGEVEDFAQLTLREPINLRFIEFMPVGARDFWRPDRVVKLGEIKGKIDHLGRLEPTKIRGNGPARYFYLPRALGTVGFIGAFSDHFCASCNRLRLTCDGRLRPCLFSESEIDLRGPLRRGCRDEELAALFLRAKQEKPLSHSLREEPPKHWRRPMSEIGG
jgi:cyclic pyranopterin phosphate synthase